MEERLQCFTKKYAFGLFNLYAEYIMRNAQLDEAQTGIKIARRNINNLSYANGTTLREELDMEKMKAVIYLIFLGSKITVDGD